jgi:hypothetical protein
MKTLTERSDDRTRLRWLIDNRWTDGASLATAQELIDRIVGFPAPGREAAAGVAQGGGPAAADAPSLVETRVADLPPIRDVPWLVPPGQTLPIVGVGFSAEDFARYLTGLRDDGMSWSPTGVTIHHTASPSLAMRPNGFETQHMRNLRSWYLSLGWSRGPHLFVDDHLIWVFSPLTARGVHAVSFNATHFGIEMLGNFDSEDPLSGRGARVLDLSRRATAALCERFEISTGRINGHRDDPKSSKTCPGRKVNLDAFRAGVASLMR